MNEMCGVRTGRREDLPGKIWADVPDESRLANRELQHASDNRRSL